MLGDNALLLIMFYGMAVFLAASIIILYQAYSCFKKNYQIQHHGGVPESGSGYQFLGAGGVRGMSQYDDPEAARRSGGASGARGGQSGYMVSGPNVNQRQPLNIQGPASQTNGRSY